MRIFLTSIITTLFAFSAAAASGQDILNLTFEELKQKAELGDSTAQTALGFEYANGDRVSKNVTEAAKWFLKAAKQGNFRAQTMIGVSYEYGKGVPQNDAEAVKWLRKAADQGHDTAQETLGFAYYTGKGITKNHVEAARLFRLAANQGKDEAQFYLAYMYENGEGVSQSYSEAANLYQQSAEQGNFKSQTNLGIMYRLGRGVSQNDTEARSWFQKAAEQGIEVAQVNLAEMDAKEIKFSSITVGVTPCYAAFEMADVNIEGSDIFISGITGGHAAPMPNNALGVNWMEKGHIICDSENGKVAAVTVDFPKSMAVDISNSLAEKYTKVEVDLPRLGNGYALYRSNTGNTEALITYEHVSFIAGLLISTPEFDKQKENYLTQKRQKEKTDLSSTF